MSQEQLARMSTINSFSIDYQKDILQGFTISLGDNNYSKEIYGKTIEGSDSFSIASTHNINNFHEILSTIYTEYKKESYKNNGYDWIDNISIVKDKSVKNNLDNKLIEVIKNKNIDLNPAPPELVNWENFDGFSPKSKDTNATLNDEIDIADYFTDDEIAGMDNIDVIKKKHINLFESGNTTSSHSWSFYKCINSDVEIDGDRYVLTDGSWYKIEKSYLESVQTWWDGQNIKDSDLPEYTKTNSKHNEGAYNDSQSNNYEVLDRKLVQLAHRSKVEVCDLYKDGKFNHIKIYKSSADISHLAAQALVSINLFIDDLDFRMKFNEKLKEKLTQEEIESPTREKYSVVLGIISNKDTLDLPFFSKINLRANLNNISRIGISYSIERIKGAY